MRKLRVWAFLSIKFKKKFITFCILQLLCSALEVVAVGLIVPFISLVSGISPGRFSQKLISMLPSYAGAQILSLGFIMIFCFVIKNALSLRAIFLQSAMIFEERRNVLTAAFRKILSMDLVDYYRMGTSNCLKLLQHDIPVAFECVILPFTALFSEVLVVMMILSMLLWVDATSTLSAGLLMASSLLVYHSFLRPHIERWGGRNHNLGKHFSDLVTSSFTSIRELKAFSRENFFTQKLDNICANHTKAWVNYRSLNDVPRLLIEVLAVVSILIISALISLQPDKREALIPFLGLFTFATFRLLPSLSRIISSLHLMSYHLPAFQSVQKVLPSLVVTNQACGSDSRIEFRERLELSCVNFSYPGAEAVTLRDVSLVIQRGRSLAILGKSGVGKTTLIGIMMGLLQPKNGKIQIDGKECNALGSGWRKNIGYVPQDPFLIDGSLRSNICLSDDIDALTNQKIWSALKQACLFEFVNSLPGGLDTKIGEDGMQLSGGQKQRLAVARALFTDPSILILDEFTSALDAQTESEILKEIWQMKAEKSLVISTHKSEIANLCDSQLVLS